MRNVLVLFLVVFTVFLSACGERVRIDPGEVGRQLTSNGIEKENRPPGSFRMETCFLDACPTLIRLQMQLTTKDIKIDKLFLPKSNVDLTNVQIGLQFRVKPDAKSIDRIFDEVKPSQMADGQMGITADMIYDTYISRKAPDAIITGLREYEVDQVLSAVPEISTFVKGKVNEMLKDTPIEVTEVGFPTGIGEPPAEVLDAKRKLYAVEEQKARDLKALAADLIVEAQRQKIQQLRAQNDLENAKILGIPSERYVYLKVMERFAEEKVPFVNVTSMLPELKQPTSPPNK